MKTEMERQFPVKFSNAIFHENPLSLCRVVVSVHADEHTHGAIFIGRLHEAKLLKVGSKKERKAGRMSEIKRIRKKKEDKGSAEARKGGRKKKKVIH